MADEEASWLSADVVPDVGQERVISRERQAAAIRRSEEASQQPLFAPVVCGDDTREPPCTTIIDLTCEEDDVPNGFHVYGDHIVYNGLDADGNPVSDSTMMTVDGYLNKSREDLLEICLNTPDIAHSPAFAPTLSRGALASLLAESDAMRYTL